MDWTSRHWKGNYAVKYWSTEWREVLFRFGGLFDQAIGAGFDGVYLDRLDAYMDWGPTGRGRKHRQASGAAMVQLVQDIAQHKKDSLDARVRYRRPKRTAVCDTQTMSRP